MIFGSIKLVYRLVTFAILAYFFFAVPLGERTLFEHTRRILGTEEAKELGRDIVDVTQKAYERVGEEGQTEENRGDAGP